MPGKKIYTGPRKPKKMKRPEQLLQIAIFNFLRPVMKFQKYEKFIAAHCPNGGYRTEYEGAIFKQMGVLAGFPDIQILFPGTSDSPPRTVFVELKAGKGSTTDSQDWFGDMMESYGIEYHVLAADNSKEAIDGIKAILDQNGVKLY